MNLNFKNRTFNFSILNEFVKSFDKLIEVPSAKSEKEYADFIRYHSNSDDEIAEYNDHFQKYVDELIRQLQIAPQIVTDANWIFLKDLPEDLLDSGHADLETKGKKLGKFLEKLTGEKVLPEFNSHSALKTLPNDFPKQTVELYTKLEKIGQQWLKNPIFIEEYERAFKKKLKNSPPHIVLEFITYYLKTGCENCPFPSYGIHILLVHCGNKLVDSASSLFKSKYTEIREIGLNYYHTHFFPPVVDLLFDAYKKEPIPTFKKKIVSILRFQNKNLKSKEIEILIDSIDKEKFQSKRKSFLKRNIAIKPTTFISRAAIIVGCLFYLIYFVVMPLSLPDYFQFFNIRGISLGLLFGLALAIGMNCLIGRWNNKSVLTIKIDNKGFQFPGPVFIGKENLSLSHKDIKNFKFNIKVNDGTSEVGPQLLVLKLDDRTASIKKFEIQCNNGQVFTIRHKCLPMEKFIPILNSLHHIKIEVLK